MINVSPAAVSATSNTMIRGAPRATPIRPTKTPIKRHSTIRLGAPKIIDFLHATGFVSVLALNFGSTELRELTQLRVSFSVGLSGLLRYAVMNVRPRSGDHYLVAVELVVKVHDVGIKVPA